MYKCPDKDGKQDGERVGVVDVKRNRKDSRKSTTGERVRALTYNTVSEAQRYRFGLVGSITPSLRRLQRRKDPAGPRSSAVGELLELARLATRCDVSKHPLMDNTHGSFGVPCCDVLFVTSIPR